MLEKIISTWRKMATNYIPITPCVIIGLFISDIPSIKLLDDCSHGWYTVINCT